MILARLRSSRRMAGFTLIEVLLASAAAAVLLVALYGLFARVVKLRDNTTARARESRVRARALAVLRNDLQNARVSISSTSASSTASSAATAATTTTPSTAMAISLTGAATSPNSRFPGYLRFTTTTGRDSLEATYGDSQEVEYYVDSDSEGANQEAGVLVRTVDRVLLADTRAISSYERLLSEVASMELSFYNGTEWTESWEVTTDNTELPQAVLVRVLPYAAQGEAAKPPLEVLVPWSTQPQ